jgi:SagB-type dehydrogenase family enzyme
MSIEEALCHRRSVREFTDEPLELWQISQLLWAAQGITDPEGLRTAPSAGALYPLELYICAGNVEGLRRGIYRYEPDGHELAVTLQRDARTELCEASLSQTCLMDAAAVFVFSAIYERTTVKYGERGLRYVHIEVGHAAQNLILQAAALDLGGVVVGAFNDTKVKRILALKDQETPLYLMAVGKAMATKAS